MCAFLLGIGGVLYGMEKPREDVLWADVSLQTNERLHKIEEFLYRCSLMHPANEHGNETLKGCESVKNDVSNLLHTYGDHVPLHQALRISRRVDHQEERHGLQDPASSTYRLMLEKAT